MKVVILAGGYGTRIRDVSEDIPKPMIPIGPYPILWHIMKTYAKFGFKDFIICLGYRGQVIKDFFLNYEAYTRDLTISFGDDGSIKYQESAGSIHKVAAQIIGAESCNGWTFWYYQSGNSLKPIDELRQRLRISN